MANSFRASFKTKIASAALLAVFLTATVTPFIDAPVYAVDTSAQQSEINRLKEEQAKIKEKIDALGDDISAQKEKQSEYEKQIINVKGQLAYYQKQLDEINAQIEEKNTAIEEATVKIEEKNAEMEEKAIELKKTDDKFRQRLDSMYRAGANMNTLTVILGSDSFADFLSQSAAIKSISANDNKLMETISLQREEMKTLKEELEVHKIAIEADKEVIETKKNELVTIQSQEQNKKSELDKLNADAQKIIDNLSSEQGGLTEDMEMTQAQIEQRENAMQELIRQEEARLAQEEADRKKAEEEANKKDEETSSDETSDNTSGETTSKPTKPDSGNSKPSTSIPNSKGWTWPCPGYSRISTYYGESGNGVHTTPHGGLDLAAPRGTPIIASRAGYVVSAGFGVSGSGFGGYGNYVFIRDSEGYYQLYAHCNSLNVRAGQTVSQGQTIATVGSTGQSTGNHLHFEVRTSSGSRLNPMNFISKP